jgi:hypothetical protein
MSDCLMSCEDCVQVKCNHFDVWEARNCGTPVMPEFEPLFMDENTRLSDLVDILSVT